MNHTEQSLSLANIFNEVVKRQTGNLDKDYVLSQQSRWGENFKHANFTLFLRAPLMGSYCKKYNISTSAIFFKVWTLKET